MFAYRGQYIECIMGIKWQNLLLFLLQDTTDDVGLLYTYRIQGRFTPWTMEGGIFPWPLQSKLLQGQTQVMFACHGQFMEFKMGTQ